MAYIGINKGQADDGSAKSMAVTADGHLEVDLHGPRLPFGSIHTESLEVEFQADPIYGINSDVVYSESGTGGSTTAANNLFTCASGTSAGGNATIQSVNRLRYRPGQGSVCKFTTVFSTPQANSVMVAGLGTAESGFYVGYNGTALGVLHNTGGVRHIESLQVTTASSTAENVTVTLDGTAFSIAVTNSGNIQKTVQEIADGTYAGWTAQAVDDTVIFLAGSVGNKTGTMSLSGTTAVGTFTEVTAGAAGTDTWITQANWNGDKLDGTGTSGVTIDPTKGNVWSIGMQYLGFGPVEIRCEVNPSGNNPTFVNVHTFDFPNSLTTPHVTQPSFPFTMSAYNTTNTTSISVSAGSFAGFIEGKKRLKGPRHTIIAETNNFVGSTASTYYPLFTIANRRVFNSRANQSVINIISTSVAHDDATPITFYLIKNATLLGNPDFSEYHSGSALLVDKAATTCTTIDRNILFAMETGQNTGLIHDFLDNIQVQPGETITLAARAVTGTATYVNGSVNIREDQ